MKEVIKPITDKHLELWQSVKDEISAFLYENKSCSKLSLRSAYTIHSAVFNFYKTVPPMCGSCSGKNKWLIIYNDLKELTTPVQDISTPAPKKRRAKRKVKK